MKTKLAPLFLLVLSACVSVSLETPSPAAPAGFVTAALPPTQTPYTPVAWTSTPDATSTPSVTIPPDCKNGAVLLRDVTIPDGTKLKAGEKFTKTWEFINSGTCPWLDYSVKFAAGDRMSAPLSAPVPLTLPGEKVQISVELVAPSAPGGYAAYFTLNDAQGKDLFIGAERTFWTKIEVGD